MLQLLLHHLNRQKHLRVKCSSDMRQVAKAKSVSVKLALWVIRIHLFPFFFFKSIIFLSYIKNIPFIVLSAEAELRQAACQGK